MVFPKNEEKLHMLKFELELTITFLVLFKLKRIII